MGTLTALLHKDGRLIIPKKLRDEMGLGAGTKLSLELNGDAIFVTPISSGGLSDAHGPVGTDVSASDLIPYDERSASR